MSNPFVVAALGCLFLGLAVVDWRLGGIRLWSQAWVLKLADRTRPLAEQYESQRGSFLSRIVSVMLGVFGLVLLAYGVRGIVG
jgi:hypothetical protein